jgi:hypothetical protein
MRASHGRGERRSTSPWLTITVIVWVASLCSAAEAQVPGLGALYRGSISVADRTIPLLDGEWTVVAVGGARGTNQGGSITPAIVHVYLAQMSGNQLSRWMRISTNTEWSPSGWKRDKEMCDRNDAHTGYSDSNHNDRDAQCWVLNHVGQTLSKNARQALIDFYRWSDDRGRPNTALCLEYYFAKRGDFLTIEYCFNPVVAGFPDTNNAAWRGNLWHPDIASKDPKKLAYLRQLKATGEDLFEKLKGVLK